jgi:hypothetical protein
MPDDLRKAAAKLFACPNWQDRIGEWADVNDAVRRLYDAFLAAPDRDAATDLWSALKTFHGMLERVKPDKAGWRTMKFCDQDLAIMARAIAKAEKKP